MITLLNSETGTILDLGAGTGRHAIKLAQRGYQVTAIDSAKQMLAQIPVSQNLQKLQFDVFTYLQNTHSQFDLIILMWNAFNEMVLTDLQGHTFFEMLKQHLNHNGKILINTLKSSTTKFIKPEYNVSQVFDDVKYDYFWKNISYDSSTNTTISQESLRINGKRLRPALIKQRWWTLPQIKKMASKYGFIVQNHKLKINNELYLVLSI